MFKRQIEAILKTATTNAKLDWRVAHCLFHVPIDRMLAKELSPRVADRLFRLKNPTASNSEFVPCLEIRQLKFSEEDVKFDTQQLEFRALPDGPLTGRIPGVTIQGVQAVRLRGASELTIAVALTFRFKVPETPVMSKLLIEQLGQSVWLTFTMQQHALALDDESETGQFVNERNKGKQARTGR